MQKIDHQHSLVVIDDEPDMAQLIADVANMSSFRVTQFHDGRDFVRNYPDDPDVIFLDLIMPEMSGMEIIDYLANRKSRARLILMTGYDTDVLQAAQQAVVNQGLNFVSAFRKPFRFDDLRTLLANLKKLLSSAGH